MRRWRAVGVATLAFIAAMVTARALPLETDVDFDGNGTSDFAVVRNTGGGPSGQVTWFAQGVAFSGAEWGLASDFFIPADYDGDNRTDFAVWRPGPAGTAAFYILQSMTGTVRVVPFGQTGDDPTVTADYDGDGLADPAVYRAGASAGQQSFWFYRGSQNNPGGNVTYIPWGINGDFPAPGDYDGDGRSDFAVQRNVGGQGVFYLLQTTAGFGVLQFGLPADVIVPGDYDGDGRTDLAVVRSSGGQVNWYVRNSSNGAVSVRGFGASATDFVTQGDYDGDGRTDIAVWRPSATPGLSAFWVLRSSDGGVVIRPFGSNGDYPVANFNVH